MNDTNTSKSTVDEMKDRERFRGNWSPGNVCDKGKEPYRREMEGEEVGESSTSRRVGN